MNRAASPPTESFDLHVVLLSRRPAIHALFREVAQGASHVTVEPLELDRGDLDAHAEALDRATVAVADVSLQLVAGIELCRELHATRPALPLVALVCCSQSLNPWHLEALLDGVVSCVLDLEATPAEVRRTVEEVVRGGSVLHLHLRRTHSPFLRELVASRKSTRAKKLRLLELVSLGLPDHEIGRRLHLSPHTVKHHIEELRGELGVRNRIELAAWAGGHGFYAPDALGTRGSAARRAAPVRPAR
jgi:DNA-binding NarL/FixJ family response regulator